MLKLESIFLALERNPLRISVVVPVYNSEKTLEGLVFRIRNSLSSEALEILLVNDASTDGSWREIARLTRTFPEVIGINLETNFGQQGALMAGVETATGKVIVTLDDDLQQPPEAIPLLLEKLAHGHDLVFGLPLPSSRPARTALVSQLAMRILNRFHSRAVTHSPFRAFQSELRARFPNPVSPLTPLDICLNWATRNPGSVSLAYAPSAVGKTRTGLATRNDLFWLWLTGLSLRPLRFATICGALALALAFSAAIWSVYQRVVGGTWPMGVVWGAGVGIFLGLQSVALGVLAQYLGRWYFHAIGVPAFRIQGLIGGSHAASSGK